MSSQNSCSGSQLPIERPCWFIGGTYTALKKHLRYFALETINIINNSVRLDFGLGTIVPILIETPGHRKGNRARQLNRILAQRMYQSDLYICILWGDYSNGVSYELDLAARFSVPVIFLKYRYISIPETFIRDELPILSILSFNTSNEALQNFKRWLISKQYRGSKRTNMDSLNKIAANRNTVRQQIAKSMTSPEIAKKLRDGTFSYYKIMDECGVPILGLHATTNPDAVEKALLTPIIVALIANEVGAPLASPFAIETEDKRYATILSKAASLGSWPFQNAIGFLIAQTPSWKENLLKLPEDLALREINNRYVQWKDHFSNKGNEHTTNFNVNDFKTIWPR